MKTIKYFMAIILFSNLFFACTADDTVEEGINNTTIEVFATGGDGEDSTDDIKD